MASHDTFPPRAKARNNVAFAYKTFRLALDTDWLLLIALDSPNANLVNVIQSYVKSLTYRILHVTQPVLTLAPPFRRFFGFGGNEF